MLVNYYSKEFSRLGLSRRYPIEKEGSLETVLRAELNRIKLVFSRFNDSLFTLNHSATLTSSAFIISNNFLKICVSKIYVVSSANKINVMIDMQKF